MTTPAHINTDELRQAWRTSGLARVMPFERATASPLLTRCLRHCALAARRRREAPQHPALARHF